MLVFLDTEFTSFHEPNLVSIGLAAETGETFYAEVPFSNESEFVRDIVVPLLGADPADLCTPDELRERLRTWLTIVKRKDDMAICYDSQHDWQLFAGIFDNRPPAFCRPRKVGFYETNELLRYEFHKKNKRPEHHALNDAEALRYAFRPRVLK